MPAAIQAADPRPPCPAGTCGATWPELRRQLDRVAVGTFHGPVGAFRQRT